MSCQCPSTILHHDRGAAGWRSDMCCKVSWQRSLCFNMHRSPKRKMRTSKSYLKTSTRREYARRTSQRHLGPKHLRMSELRALTTLVEMPRAHRLSVSCAKHGIPRPGPAIGPPLPSQPIEGVEARQRFHGSGRAPAPRADMFDPRERRADASGIDDGDFLVAEAGGTWVRGV